MHVQHPHVRSLNLGESDIYTVVWFCVVLPKSVCVKWITVYGPTCTVADNYDEIFSQRTRSQISVVIILFVNNKVVTNCCSTMKSSLKAQGN